MKSALKRKWVAALRSGKYKRGQDVLRNTEREVTEWCCLGVLADVAGCRFEKDGYLEKGRNASVWYIPPTTAKRLGIQPAGDVEDTNIQRQLAEKNDAGWSFKRIATWIEKNL